MKFPAVQTLSSPIVHVTKNGQPTPDFHLMLTQLLNVLQQNLGNQGYIFPGQNSAQISNLNTSDHKSKILYDTDAQAMKLNNDGEFKEIYTRPPQLTTAERTAISTDKINGSWVYDTDLNKLYYGINQVWREVAFT